MMMWITYSAETFFSKIIITQQYAAFISVFMCGTGGRIATEKFVSSGAEKLAVNMDEMEQ